MVYLWPMSLAEYRMKSVKTGGSLSKKTIFIHEKNYDTKEIILRQNRFLCLNYTFYKFICSRNNTSSYTYVTQN